VLVDFESYETRFGVFIIFIPLCFFAAQILFVLLPVRGKFVSGPAFNPLLFIVV